MKWEEIEADDAMPLKIETKAPKDPVKEYDRHGGRWIQIPRLKTEAAAAQNKFWQMYDYFFEHQKALDDNHLLEYVQKVGLDIDK